MPPDPRDLICGAYPTFRSELDCVKSIDIFGNSSIHSKIFSLRSLDWSMRRKNSPFRVGFHPCRIFRDILASVIGRLGTEGESVQIVLFEQLFIEARRQVSRGLVVSRNVPQMFARKRHAKLVLVCCFALIALTVIPRVRPINPVPPQTQGHVSATHLESTNVRVSSSRSVPASDPALPPVVQGWGGVTIDEVANGQLQPALQRLNQSGYNGIRIMFSGTVTPCSSGELGSWNPDWFNQAIQEARQYNMWIILDYHSYLDLTNGCQTEWLAFWNLVLSTNWGYDRIVWEPINEPAGLVTVLSSAYQVWITQARTLGDKHWIAVENTMSNGGCNFDPLSLVNCYPVVMDPLNETFLSIHPYLFYDLWSSTTNTYGNCSPSSANTWGNTTAECVADIYNRGMLQASSKYHMPILDTEGGAVYYSCNNVCANPPDTVGTDDASYSYTTFHFIQNLTSLMQSENMGWVWWEAGEGSCCGALDTWGGC